jgi:hypothetical protein
MIGKRAEPGAIQVIETVAYKVTHIRLAKGWWLSKTVHYDHPSEYAEHVYHPGTETHYPEEN